MAALVILTKVIASNAVAVRARCTSAETVFLDLVRAECRSGCIEVSSFVRFDAIGEKLVPCVYLDDDDAVVAVVAAVRGRSATLNAVAPDELGSTPVCSSCLILDFMSSNSSQTVEGAVVEIADSALSARADGIGRSWSNEPCLAVKGEEW